MNGSCVKRKEEWLKDFDKTVITTSDLHTSDPSYPDVLLLLCTNSFFLCPLNVFLQY